MSVVDVVDRSLALELVRVTEAAAIAAGRWVGLGDKDSVDGAAVQAMRLFLETVRMRGVVVIGEGEKDQAPMLYNGEVVGDGGGSLCDVAVDPVDGTRLAAFGMNNALAVLALSDRGSMYDASSVFYMDKLVTGCEAAGLVDIRLPVGENLRIIAKAKGVAVSELTAVVLDRPRHVGLVEQIRRVGVRVKLLADGDVAGAIAAVRPGTGVDVLFGVGGTPEGVLAACAIKTLGGVIQGRLHPMSVVERERGLAAGCDFSAVLCTDDLVGGGNCYFAATGVTDGDLLSGVKYRGGTVFTSSIVMRSRSGTVRVVAGEHREAKLG